MFGQRDACSAHTMRWSSLCLTAALLLVIMLLPRPKLSLTMHHTVAASPSYPADPVHPRAEPLPPMQELPPSLAAVLLSPPPPPAATGVERGGYTFFSTDYHIAPIADITDVFDSLCKEARLLAASRPEPDPRPKPTPDPDPNPIPNQGLCMHVEEHSFSGACGKKFGGRKPTCARGLKVVTA